MIAATSHFRLVGRGAAACAALALTLGLLGCASPGVPKAPSLRLPSPATGLAGERIGSNVTLSWQTPANTTDGQSNRLPITAVLCRELVAAGSPGPGSSTKAQAGSRPKNSACTEVARLAVSAGRGTVTDRLPPELTTGLPRLLAYRIELFNKAGRSAKPSEAAFAAAGQAPPAAGEIRVIPVRQGVTVQWEPAKASGNAGFMELRRILQIAPGGITPRGGAKPSAKPGDRPAGARPAAEGPVVLRSEESLAGGHDPGGVLDPAVHPGDTVTYIAQRVQRVTLAGHTLELRGEPSAPVTLTDTAIFPPRAPERLSTVATPALGPNPPEIDLSWEGNEESDLLVYNVYRSAPGEQGGSFRRLNTEPLAGPAYRDLTARPGVTYRYRVTAVDEAQHEGPPSATVEDKLPRSAPDRP